MPKEIRGGSEGKEKEKAFQKKSVEEVKRKRKDFGIDNAFQKKAVEEVKGKRKHFGKEKAF